MRRLSAPALLLLLLPLACVVHVREGGSGDQPEALDQSEASKPNGPEVSEPEVEGEPPARASTPSAADCPADADADTYCTQAGKLAGRWVPVDTLRPPTSAQVVFEATHADIEQQPSLSILLDGETIYIKWIHCGSCRRVIGFGFSGDLAAMSDEQLRALQTKLALPPDSGLLDSGAAWRRYVDGDAGKATLTELSVHVSR
jgi:hypothetical protein